jgi:3-oxoacyl-[acyl-carrier protein] reductase
MTDQSSDLSGKAVVITGGSRGIGFASARAFLERGARVAFCGLDEARLRAAERALGELGEVAAWRADVGNYADVASFIGNALAWADRIDVLVNNAGQVWRGDFAAQTEPDIDRVIDVNVKGVMYATHALLPYFLSRRQGTIVNLASGAGLVGLPGVATYCASKFAVVGFTQSLAAEASGYGVSVYAVCPGQVATDMQVEYSGARVGMPPERVADAIVALAGPEAPIAPGECLTLSW